VLVNSSRYNFLDRWATNWVSDSLGPELVGISGTGALNS
jgi:hypothetical protein